MNYFITAQIPVNINTIKIGDTVLHNGVMRTVDKNAIGGDYFVGRTLWGDSYKSGNTPVTKIVTEKANAN